MKLPFAMGQGPLRKPDVTKNGIWKGIPFLAKNSIFLSFGEKFTYANACAVQTKYGTNKLLHKNYAEEYGQSGSVEKR